jgi:hypothetical protein
MYFGQAEQLCTRSVDMYSCLYSNIQVPGASQASVEVLFTHLGNLGQTKRYTAVFVELLAQIKILQNKTNSFKQELDKSEIFLAQKLKYGSLHGPIN